MQIAYTELKMVFPVWDEKDMEKMEKIYIFLYQLELLHMMKMGKKLGS